MSCAENDEEKFCGFSVGTGTKSTGSEEANNQGGYWIQSPFCKHRQGSYADEVLRYLEYDRFFFVAYAGAVAGFFFATIVFFWLGGAGHAVRDPAKMTQFMTTLRETLDSKSTGLATKLAGIKTASREGFLKLYRFQMFESFAALKVGDLSNAIKKLSKRVLGVLMKLVTKPDYTCESFAKALDTSWITEEKYSTDILMEKAVKSINESGVLPFYTTLGEHNDRICVDFAPKIVDSMEHDLIPKLFNDKAFFCPDTKSGTVTGEVLSSIAEELFLSPNGSGSRRTLRTISDAFSKILRQPTVDTKACDKDFITKWNGFVASLTADVAPERRPFLNAVFFESIKLSGTLKAPKSLETLQGLGNWVLTSRDKCAFSALSALMQAGLDDKKFTKKASEESVLAALDKLHEQSRLGACEEVFVNVFMRILIQ